MQDIQNIPNPDVNSNEANEDFGSHSAIEQDLDNDDIEQVDDDEIQPLQRVVDDEDEPSPDVEPQ